MMQDDSGRILKYRSTGHEFEVGKKQEELERGEDGNYASAGVLCKILRNVNEIISCFYP